MSARHRCCLLVSPGPVPLPCRLALPAVPTVPALPAPSRLLAFPVQQGGGWNVFLLVGAASKALGKLYAGPGLSLPMGWADSRSERARNGDEDFFFIICPSSSVVSPPLSPTMPRFALIVAAAATVAAAAATATAVVEARLDFGRGPANVVPHGMLGRTLYAPGPGVSFAVPAARRVSSRSMYRT